MQVLYNRDDFKDVQKVLTTFEAERCFSCLKTIKTFLRSTTEEERLTFLAMMSVDNEIVNQLEDFNERVNFHYNPKKEE